MVLYYELHNDHGFVNESEFPSSDLLISIVQ